jgi:hypothetical protein
LNNLCKKILVVAAVCILGGIQASGEQIWQVTRMADKCFVYLNPDGAPVVDEGKIVQLKVIKEAFLGSTISQNEPQCGYALTNKIFSCVDFKTTDASNRKSLRFEMSSSNYETKIYGLNLTEKDICPAFIMLFDQWEPYCDHPVFKITSGWLQQHDAFFSYLVAKKISLLLSELDLQDKNFLKKVLLKQLDAGQFEMDKKFLEWALDIAGMEPLKMVEMINRIEKNGVFHGTILSKHTYPTDLGQLITVLMDWLYGGRDAVYNIRYLNCMLRPQFSPLDFACHNRTFQKRAGFSLFAALSFLYISFKVIKKSIYGLVRICKRK